MDILNCIKIELKDWKLAELIPTVFVLFSIFISAIILNHNILAFISGFFGVMYTVLAGKGKVSAFYFGLIGSFAYSVLSIQHQLWGQCLLYLCYYVPMQATGIVQWKKNLKTTKNEIVKTRLSLKESIILSVVAIISSAICVFILMKYTNDAFPLFDGITPILSMIGMYLTVKRCIEQWWVWIIVNGLTTVIWIHAIINGSTAYAAAIMWAFYFIMAFYFFAEWNKEVKILRF